MRRSVILETLASRVVVSVVLLLSLFLLVTGTSAPGGGFVAGLLAAAAIVIRLVSAGWTGRPPLLPGDLIGFLAAGLAVSLLTGAAALVAGRPFLTSAHGRLALPIIGVLEYESPLLFEIGIYVVVVGGVLLVVGTVVEGE